MIKESHLRPGNLYRYEGEFSSSGYEVGKAFEFSQDFWYWCQECCLDIEETNSIYLTSDVIQFLPFTEFVDVPKYKKYIYNLSQTVSLIFEKSTRLFFISIEGLNFPCTYIHELQNIMSICLNVELDVVDLITYLNNN